MKKEHEERIERIRQQVQNRKLKDVLSDEEVSDDEPFPVQKAPGFQVDMDEYQLAKAQKRAAKVEIQKWVREFKQKNGRAPNDSDTAPIAMELADYNHANEKYLEMKVALIK